MKQLGQATIEPVTMVFLGHFKPESFAEFVRHRAARLSLGMRLGTVSDERVEVAVEGAADLVDMFEMACSLGPIDCLVLDIYRNAERQ
jgi:acylphosphatase